MSTPFHPELAEQAYDAAALPPPPRTVQHALTYITRLLSMLPPVEAAGYVKGPAGGENVAALPDGTLVRVSRVMYPDGQIVKVMSDAPNGGPQWVLEDVRPDLYVPYSGTTVPTPPPADGLELRVKLLETRMAIAIEMASAAIKETAITKQRVEAINDRLIAVDAASVKHGELPDYEGSGRVGFWGGSFTVTSRPKG